MFDALLRNRSASDLWIPRVYRILDTIADLDPNGVQVIEVRFHGDDRLPKLTTHLPLPKSNDDVYQDQRKELVVRYIVAQAYNFAVVRRVTSISFRCSQVNELHSVNAFTDEGLAKMVADVEKTSGYRPPYANYIQRYGFEKFEIAPGSSGLNRLGFGRKQFESGTYIGLDIGGTLVKCEVFTNGLPLGDPMSESVNKTDRIANPVNRGVMDMEAFWVEILDFCNTRLKGLSLDWSEVNGIGVSWPGAIRSNRLTCMSGVLRKLRYNANLLDDLDPVDLLPAIPVTKMIRDAAEAVANRTQLTLRPDFSVAIQNDGDAEALGNYAIDALSGDVKHTGRIVVKYGTSVAGGRITPAGAVVEEVAEYAKVVLRLDEPASNWPSGTAREFAAAAGFAKLIRDFEIDGELPFSFASDVQRAGKHGILDPVDLGLLLPIAACTEGYDSFLESLVKVDNRSSAYMIRDFAARVEQYLDTSGKNSVLNVIRGYQKPPERERRSYVDAASRLVWVTTRQEIVIGMLGDGDLPKELRLDHLARSVVGSVCLFSQMALQLAHLIAQLYNVYRRGTFTEVLLAGGVLSGETGRLFEQQTRAFLSKYYDKIYGVGKALLPGSVKLVGNAQIGNPGAFGAALGANRERQITLANSISLEIERRSASCNVGEVLDIRKVVAANDYPGATELVGMLGDNLVSTGAFYWYSGDAIQRIAMTQEV
jgi:hypothetical protein